VSLSQNITGWSWHLNILERRRSQRPSDWRIAGVKIVDNLAALVAVLDRSFVPEIEAASGPSRRVFSDVNGFMVLC
jgi:hypothetical protein